MCGIIAILLADKSQAVNQEIYDGLTALQHRGQDAAGIVTLDTKKKLHCYKEMGLVRDVFKLQHMLRLIGAVGLGHVRYPTAGASSDAQQAQPFLTNIPFGMALAHNGNLTNALEITSQLSAKYHTNTDSDSELLLSLFADELLKQDRDDSSQSGLTKEIIFSAARGLMSRSRGGYASIVMIKNCGIVAFRDPWGIRPLCYGKRPSVTMKDSFDYCIASESVAMHCMDYSLTRDIAPGEAVFITLDGQIHTQMCHDSPSLNPCIFEYVYFGRQDSIIDSVSVYTARKEMGHNLAEKIKGLHNVDEIDVVVPVPETARISAIQCALSLGVDYEEGLTKNRYIARTFIMPGQAKRKKNVKKKLSPIRSVFEGKNVLLVDDSIVRGTTSEQIVSMVRSCGANKVFFCSASPAIRYPNVYGIDMPVSKELIAYGRNESQVAQAINADWVVYQDLEDLIKSVQSVNQNITGFDTSCFNGVYVTKDVDAHYFQNLADTRSDSMLQHTISEDVDNSDNQSHLSQSSSSSSISNPNTSDNSDNSENEKEMNDNISNTATRKNAKHVTIDLNSTETNATSEGKTYSENFSSSSPSSVVSVSVGENLKDLTINENEESSPTETETAPRGRQIVNKLRELEPENATSVVKNADYIRMRDRLSGL